MLLIVIQSPRASTHARAEVTNQCISRHNQHVVSINEIHMQTFLQKKMQFDEVALSISLGGYTEGYRVSCTLKKPRTQAVRVSETTLCFYKQER